LGLGGGGAGGGGGLALLVPPTAALAVGAVSYSLFVSQWLPFRALDHLLPAGDYAGRPLAVRLVVLAAYLLCIALTALLLYWIVEKPAGRWLRGLWRRPAPSPADLTAAPARSPR